MRPTLRTKAHDDLNRRLAPALYLALAAVGLAVVPFADGIALIDSPVSIVVWGSSEALTIIMVYRKRPVNRHGMGTPYRR